MAEVIEVDGLTMVAEHPTGATRPPILFIHGYFATASTFVNYLPYFAAKAHPAYAVNLRGREGSLPGTRIGQVSLADYVSDATAAARWIGRPIVVGHSMGGLLAQKLAELDLVRAAVLVAPAPPKGIPLMTIALMRSMFRYLPAFLLSRPVTPRFENMRAVAFNRIPAAEQRRVFAGLVPDSGCVGRQLGTEAISVDPGKIRCPVLTIVGSDDRMIPPRVVRRIASRYGSPLSIAADHAHMIPLEPGWAGPAAAIVRWLEGLTDVETGQEELSV